MQVDNSNQVVVSPEVYAKRHARSSYFRQGYEDYINGKPFNYDIEDKGSSIRYERGRAFAIYSLKKKTPRAVWRNNILAKTAQERFIKATKMYWVI